MRSPWVTGDTEVPPLPPYHKEPRPWVLGAPPATARATPNGDPERPGLQMSPPTKSGPLPPSWLMRARKLAPITHGPRSPARGLCGGMQLKIYKSFISGILRLMFSDCHGPWVSKTPDCKTAGKGSDTSQKTVRKETCGAVRQK